MSSSPSNVWDATGGSGPVEASTSRQPYAEDGVGSDDELDLLAADPLEGELGANLTFKRKQKPSPSSSTPFSLPRFLSAASPLSTGSSRTATPLRSHRRNASRLTDPDSKEPSAIDWGIPEGPGRRVAYDDMTAIDWIFEYAKERSRLRLLKSTSHGIVGQLRLLADASAIWLVLIATGVAAGVLAGGIDVVSDWLGDLKGGVCGSRWYLSRAFCCWGVDEPSQCKDWGNWGAVFGAGRGGGGWMLEYVLFLLFSVLFAATASLLVRDYAVYAKHSGIAEVKTVLGGFVMKKFMGTWTLIIKSLGLCLAVASGLWLGKEGPLVHVACCCANLFVKAFPTLNTNEARKREILSAAAAAGISVAFGSPVGGVLFSLEQLSFYFPDKTMWQSFVCAMVAAVTLQAFNPFRTGKLVLYQVTYHSGWHGFEMIPFALLGILGGLYGGLFIKMNMKVAEWRRNRPIFKGPVLEVVVVAVVTALVNYPVKFMRAQASELVYTLFAECIDLPTDQLGLCKSGRANTGVVALLILASLLGFLLASITFGLQIPAGIILPSMAIGALYGRAVGLVVEVWQQSHPNWFVFATCEPDIPCVTPGTYAIIGAASALGGATRMTVSIVVIMFELTGALTYVLPIMIAVMLSKWVGDAIEPRGIYEAWIKFNGYPFLDNRDDDAVGVPDVPASQVFTRIEDLVVITATGHTIESLQTLLKEHQCRGFPIINSTLEAILLGYISRTELTFALNTATSLPRSLPPETETFFASDTNPLADPNTTLDLRPWMDATPITLSANSSFMLAVSMFQKLGLRYVLFTARGRLRGLITKKDVWLCLNGEAVEMERREDYRGGDRDDDAGTGLLDGDGRRSSERGVD